VTLPRPLAGRRRRLFALLVVVGLGQSGCGVLFALLVHTAVGRLTASRGRLGRFDPFGSWPQPAVAAVALLAVVAMAALRGVGRPLAERLAQDYTHSLRLAMFDHITASAVRDRSRRSVGVTVLRMTGDTSALHMWISRGLAAVVVDGAAVLGALGALIMTAPVVGVVGVVLVAVAFTVVVELSLRLRRLVRVVRRQRGRLSTRVNERITHTLVVQAMGEVTRERGRVRGHSSRLADAMVRQAWLDGAFVAVAEVVRSGLVVVAVAAGLLGGENPGTVGAALTVVHLLGVPLRELADAVRYRQEAHVARQRIGEMFVAPARLAAPPDAPGLAPGPGRIELDGVTVRGVIEEATAVGEAGQRIAVVGARGTGKSSLLAVLARLQPVDQGRVRLDGQDIAAFEQDSVRQAVRLVSADLPLLRGTVEQNLRYGGGDPDVPGWAGELCGLDTLFAALPNGSQTKIGDGGQGLSRSQRHQLTLARALLSRPRLLLLDDVDMWPDTTTSSIMWELLARCPATILLVTQDPQLLARVDAVWSLRDGALTTRSMAGEGEPRANPSGIVNR
jgi:ATP-binding cassette, subfamily B, bacterial